MSFQLPQEDTLDQMVAAALERLSAGALPPQVESTHVDVKEEPGRRARDGTILEGQRHSDVDPVAWQAHALRRLGYDWSAQASAHTLDDVSPLAAEAARSYLREADTAAGRQLAEVSDRDLLTRLGVVDVDARLTHAGSLLFVRTPCDGIDYIRRESAGGDSVERIRTSKPLLVQMREVEQAGRVANPITHVPLGFAHRQVRTIPERAFREAIVNGITHRDWMAPLPTVVEHVGAALTVTSPGGLIGGVTPDNAMTHPAVPRYRSLAHALALMHVAEQQGIGIDRMVLDLLSIGRPAPVIEEIDGPYVRVTLLGGEPDAALIRLVAAVEPPTAADVSGLLAVEHLCRRGWIDARAATRLLQADETAVATALARLGEATIEGEPAISEVRGADHWAERGPAYRLSDAVVGPLAHRCSTRRSREAADAMFVDWAQARGRISSTTAADLADISTRLASERLRLLAERGDLMPGRANGTGRGYHYVPAPGP